MARREEQLLGASLVGKADEKRFGAEEAAEAKNWPAGRRLVDGVSCGAAPMKVRSGRDCQAWEFGVGSRQAFRPRNPQNK